jgi:hypothetical protein
LTVYEHQRAAPALCREICPGYRLADSQRRDENAEVAIERGINVNCEQPAGFVLQERIDAEHLVTRQVIEECSIRDGKERLV